MVVVGVLVTDADDAESLQITSLRARIRSPVELHFDFHVDVLAVQIIADIMNLLGFQEDSAAALYP